MPSAEKRKSQSEPKERNIAAIVGGVAALAIIGSGIWLYQHRHVKEDFQQVASGAARNPPKVVYQQVAQYLAPSARKHTVVESFMNPNTNNADVEQQLNALKLTVDNLDRDMKNGGNTRNAVNTMKEWRDANQG